MLSACGPMVTANSPVFIDPSRDNTSIVRVERIPSGVVQGTSFYRPKTAEFADEGKVELKFLNLCDPCRAEILP